MCFTCGQYRTQSDRIDYKRCKTRRDTVWTTSTDHESAMTVAIEAERFILWAIRAVVEPTGVTVRPTRAAL